MPRLLFALAAAVMAIFTATTLTAQTGYAVRAGDTLRIEVLEDATLNRSALVAPDGRISVPLAGGIRAAGRTVEDIQSDLSTRLAPSFATPPTVYVALEGQKEVSSGPFTAATIDIFVMGEAASPGKLAVTPGTTMLQLFAQMGGFSKFAATKRIQLRRGDQAWGISYPAIEAGTSTLGSTVLADGDVIVIPQRKLFE
jgi:polysaccharide export outer membrane protein